MDGLKYPNAQTSQARAGYSSLSGGVGRAKGLGSKATMWGKKFALHLVLFLFFGLVLGIAAFLDFFGTYDGSVPNVVFLITAGLSILLGVLHDGWLIKQNTEQDVFWPELLTTLATMVCLMLGAFCGHWFFPNVFLEWAGGVSRFAAILSVACVPVVVPFLLRCTFNAAMDLRPVRYELWHYPVNYREKQHTWSKDRVIIANLHFKRRENEDLVTTVNARLPLEANFGELIYLFVKDYNENRFPSAPIEGLFRANNSLGWLFHTRRFLLSKQRRFIWSSRILDPNLTIEQNGISRNADIYFERVIETRDNDE